MFSLSDAAAGADGAGPAEIFTVIDVGKQFHKQIELIHDFKFPMFATRVVQSDNGNFIFGAGGWPPQVHCYETGGMSMKFKRHVDFEINDIAVLSEDYKKFALLQSERWVELHAQGGRYHRVRVPKSTRSMAYHHSSCTLLISTSCEEVFQLNLQDGTFHDSICTGSDEGVNQIAVCPLHELVGMAGADGEVYCADLRREGQQCLGGVKLEEQLTAIQFDADGITMAVGTETGGVHIYDLRMSRPLHTQDHNYGCKVHRIQFLTSNHFTEGSFGARSNSFIATACDRSIKLWDKTTGMICAALETGSKINDFCVAKAGSNLEYPFHESPHSGLIFVAGESQNIKPFFVPNLGTAPNWCGTLDSIAHAELEAPTVEIVHNQKFITREEFDELNLQNFRDSDKIKPHMHGFLIDAKLHRELRAMLVSNTSTTEWKSAKQQRKEDKVKERLYKSFTRAVRVNEEHLDFVLGPVKDKSTIASEVDPRFKRIFEDYEYSIEEGCPEYERMRAGKKKRKIDEPASGASLVLDIDTELVKEIKDKEDENGHKSDSGDGMFSDSDRSAKEEARKKKRELKKAADRSKKPQDFERKVRLFEVPQGDLTAFSSEQDKKDHLRRKKEAELPMGMRAELRKRPTFKR